MTRHTPAQKVAVVGLLSALAMALSFLEGLLPAVGVPGVRLGLANIAVTVGLWLFGPGAGGAIGVCKVLFVLVTRGASAALLSAAGTLAAVLVTAAMLLLYKKERVSFIGVSIPAAAAHAAGQLIVAAYLLTAAVTAYAPIMLLLSVPAGLLTGVILNGLIPRLPSLWRECEKG